MENHRLILTYNSSSNLNAGDETKLTHLGNNLETDSTHKAHNVSQNVHVAAITLVFLFGNLDPERNFIKAHRCICQSQLYIIIRWRRCKRSYTTS